MSGGTDGAVPPKARQLGAKELVQMSLGSLRLHARSSLLQGGTIAATAAFLMFVLGERLIIRAAADLPTAVANPRSRLAQLGWMLAIALAVCVLSNVTSMLFSVSKRFREIGTMKCLGAFDESVVALFLVEAALLGSLGAVSGAVLGVVLTVATALAAHGSAVLSAAVAARLIGSALATAAVVGLLSLVGAAYPAWLAGRMLPVEAMRR